MNEAGQNGESRRDFLRGGVRYTLLTALGSVSAALFKRSGGRLSGQTCTNQGICGGCGVFADCGLPQALSAKQSQLSGSRRKEAQASPARNQSLLSSSATTPKKGGSS